MKHAAYLIGISEYSDYALKGISNDLELIAQALRHRGFPQSAIHVFDNTHTTKSQLLALLAQIRAQFSGVDVGTCYLHLGASGALSLDPLIGGVLPTDGNLLDFSTVVPYSLLNEFLPIRPEIKVTVTIDT